MTCKAGTLEGSPGSFYGRIKFGHEKGVMVKEAWESQRQTVGVLLFCRLSRCAQHVLHVLPDLHRDHAADVRCLPPARLRMPQHRHRHRRRCAFHSSFAPRFQPSGSNLSITWADSLLQTASALLLGQVRATALSWLHCMQARLPQIGGVQHKGGLIVPLMATSVGVQFGSQFQVCKF